MTLVARLVDKTAFKDLISSSDVYTRNEREKTSVFLLICLCNLAVLPLYKSNLSIHCQRKKELNSAYLI